MSRNPDPVIARDAPPVIALPDRARLSDTIIERGPFVAGQMMPFPTTPNGHPIISAAEFNELRDELIAARAAIELLRHLTDPDPCQLDHNGFCQAHYATRDGQCDHARAKELLAEVDR